MIDDETIASNVRETLVKLRECQSAGLAGKRCSCNLVVSVVSIVVVLLIV